MSYFRDDRTIYFTALTLFCQKRSIY